MAMSIAFISPITARTDDPPFILRIIGSSFTASSKIVFGGTVIDATNFVDDSTIWAVIPKSAYASYSLGGVSVSVKDGTDFSNKQSFFVTSPSPVTVGDLTAIVSGINLPDVTSLTTAANPYVKPIPHIQVYQVRDGDTLQSIAYKNTGDPSSWVDIAVINNLRYPFISKDQAEFQGAASYAAVLTKRVNPGDLFITINGASQFVTPEAVFFFRLSNTLTNGVVSAVSDVLVVDSVQPDFENPANTRVKFKLPIGNTFLAGTSVDVLSTSNNTTSRVVAPGSHILVPTTQSNSSFVRSNPFDVSRVYAMLGTDFYLNDDGFFEADDGDVRTVSGVDNLQQALYHRLISEKFQLTYHPDYGNALLDYVGYVNTPTLAIMAKQEMQRTLLADPRVKQIENIVVRAFGDTLDARAVVSIDLFNTTQEFNFVIPTDR